MNGSFICTLPWQILRTFSFINVHILMYFICENPETQEILAELYTLNI